MKTKTINLYTASELKEQFPQAFERARAGYNDTQDNYWIDATVDDFLRIAALMGFQVEHKNIRGRGFCSQGDGASFTGSAVFDPDALAKVKAHAPVHEKLHAIAGECEQYGKDGVTCQITRTSHHYSHENTVTVESFQNDLVTGECGQPPWVAVQETCRALMRWLYGQLEKEYEYRSGEECFLETAEANDWNFTEAGELE